jgi:hypothetical protein
MNGCDNARRPGQAPPPPIFQVIKGYAAMSFSKHLVMFWENILIPSSGLKSRFRKKHSICNSKQTFTVNTELLQTYTEHSLLTIMGMVLVFIFTVKELQWYINLANNTLYKYNDKCPELKASHLY